MKNWRYSVSLRERKNKLKKQEITESALKVLSEKGYHATTMEEVAARLLMTKGSVYYYFKDKQHLVYESQIMLLEQSIENMSRIKSKALTIEAELLESIVVHIEYVLAERAGFELMANFKEIFSNSQVIAIEKIRKKYAVHYDELLKLGVEDGIFHIDDIKLVRNLVLGAMNWMAVWYAEGGEKSKEEIAHDVGYYLLRIIKDGSN